MASCHPSSCESDENTVATLRRRLTQPFIPVAAGALAFAALFCAGCGSVKTDVALDAPVRPHWRVLVLPLDDRSVRREAMENSIYGATGSQGSSTVAAHGVSGAFACQSSVEIISAVALRDELDRVKMTLMQAAMLDSGKACDLARNVNADMVILGRVPRYENAWVLFVPCAKVALVLEGYDPSTKQKLWSAEVSGRKMFASEKQLAFDLASEAACQVQAHLTQPVTP